MEDLEPHERHRQTLVFRTPLLWSPIYATALVLIYLLLAALPTYLVYFAPLVDNASDGLGGNGSESDGSGSSGGDNMSATARSTLSSMWNPAVSVLLVALPPVLVLALGLVHLPVAYEGEWAEVMNGVGV